MLNDKKIPHNQVKEIIYDCLDEILQEKGDKIDYDDNSKINAHLGLTSLEFARVVAILEGKLNYDPFSENVAISSIRTIGNLINAYSSNS